jgi:hypothetical protein
MCRPDFWYRLIRRIADCAGLQLSALLASVAPLTTVWHAILAAI